jgi:hypothetical protein
LSLALAALALAAWSRVDPLPAVPHLERILMLACREGALWASAAVIAGAALLVPFVAPPREQEARAGVGAALAYLVATFVVTFVGTFPVPCFGAGAGPVLGYDALHSLRAGTGRTSC